MAKYKYYVLTYMTGIPREIYRCEEVAPKDFGLTKLWRAKKDGSWTDDEWDVKSVLNLWMKGEFDPEDDEISEEKAAAYLSDWRSSGSWPGRE